MEQKRKNSKDDKGVKKQKPTDSGKSSSTDIKTEPKASTSNTREEVDDAEGYTAEKQKNSSDKKTIDFKEKEQPKVSGNVLPNWREFKYRPNYYCHRLKEKYTSLCTTNDYEEFDTLIHVTSFDSAKNIFEDGELKQQVVGHSSVITINKGLHPLTETKVLWYGPYQRETLKKSDASVIRYGNVVFSMKTLFGLEGIYREAGDFNYYFVEIIDYNTQSACRILITKKEYPELLKYDPYQSGGPWYIENGRHKHLKTIENIGGDIVKNSLEFMREEEDSFKPIWLANHDISYTNCYNRRCKDVNGRRDLALGLLSYKMKYPEQAFIQQLCLLNGDDVLEILNRELKRIEKGEFRNIKYEDGEEKKDQDNDKLKREFDLKGFIMLLLTKPADTFFECNSRFDFAKYLFTFTDPLHIPRLQHELVEIVREHLLYENSDSDSNEIAALQYNSETLQEDGEEISYKHWHPKYFKKEGDEHYTEFDTITHVTSFETAFKIFEEGKLNQITESDASLINDNIRYVKQGGFGEKDQNIHQLSKSRMLTYYAMTRQNVKDGAFETKHDGKVVFVMKNLNGHEGIVERTGDENFHYYFLEVVENCTESTSVCKILVSKNVHRQLTPYDPKEKGGPWYVENGRHRYLEKIENMEGTELSNTVEFRREERNNLTLMAKWTCNHEIWCNTNNGRTSNDDLLKLSLGLLACKFNEPENKVLGHWFMLGGNMNIFEGLKETHDKIQQNILDFDHSSDTSYPDCLSEQIVHLMGKSNFGQNGEEIIELYKELNNQLSCKDMNMIDLTEGILKFYRKLCFDNGMKFEDIYKKLLSLINPDQLPLFHTNLAQELQCHVLHRIHKRSSVKYDWKHYTYHIKHSEQKKGMLTHWLPDDYTSLGKDGVYEKFDVLVKSKDETMVRYDEHSGRCGPKLHQFQCASVANVKNELYEGRLDVCGNHFAHPLTGANIYRYTADKEDRIKVSAYRKQHYGENTFKMSSLWGDEGVYRHKDEFYYYLIEIIDYPDESVCRILATYRKKYPALLQIDIKGVEGGPWKQEDDKHFSLKKIRNYNGNLVKCRTEIVRDVIYRGLEVKNWEINHDFIR